MSEQRTNEEQLYQCPECRARFPVDDLKAHQCTLSENPKLDRLKELHTRAYDWRSYDGLSEDKLAEVALWAHDEIERLRAALEQRDAGLRQCCNCKDCGDCICLFCAIREGDMPADSADDAQK